MRASTLLAVLVFIAATAGYLYAASRQQSAWEVGSGLVLLCSLALIAHRMGAAVARRRSAGSDVESAQTPAAPFEDEPPAP